MDSRNQTARCSLSATLASAARSLPADSISVRELLALVGDQGLLMLCIILMVPFLLPVSVPGVSTLFSTVVMFTGTGIMLDRRGPWLPRKVMDRMVGTRKLVPALDKGSRLFRRLDRMCRPRMPALITGGAIMRFNGVMLLLSGILLIFPLGGVPLSNTLPALAVVFIAGGVTQSDGLFVLLGYVMNALSIAYFALLAFLVLRAGKGLAEYFTVLAGAGF